MGKGKAKASKIAEKSAIKNAKREVKRAARESNGVVKPSHLQKSQPQSKSHAAPLPTTTPKPLLKPHAKWPSLIKRHLGVIEAHIKALDRVVQSMKSEMELMGEEEREKCELEEPPGGKWRLVCGMVDRAREVLGQARECGRGILPDDLLRDKKGLGVRGMWFEMLGEGLSERAENGNVPVVDGEGDSEMEDVSDMGSDGDDSPSCDSNSSSDDEAENDKKATVEEEKTEKKPVPVVEPNPYFVIDTQPMPVRGLNKHPQPTIKKSKRLSEGGEDGEVKKSKKSKKEKVPEEDVEAEPAKEKPAQNGDSKKSKKRSYDDSDEAKKAKKSKKEKAIIPTASKSEPATTNPQPQPEPAPPAPPAPKNSKKRSNSTTDDTTLQKYKKHKSAEPETHTSIVDFDEIQKKLQAEVDAGEKEKVVEMVRRKRRRSSGEGVERVKKVRKGRD